MSWSNPHEPSLVQTDSYPVVYSTNRSEFGSRARRLLADTEFFERLYRPWMNARSAMDLAVDRERLIDNFRD